MRELVLRAQSGDRDAFTVLASGYVNQLHRAARLVLRNDDGAAEAVQEALVQAWLDIRAVRDPEKFERWLHRLVIRSCYRVAGRERRQHAIAIAVDRVADRISADTSRELALRDELERGLLRLNPQQRAVLVAHYYLGLSDAEAADVLSIPTGTFKSRLHRATAALRAAIDADERRTVDAGEAIA